MRRWVWAGAVLVVALASYWAWPLIGAAKIARAARQGDIGEMVARMDVPRLRRSLAKQVAAAYLDATGKTQKLGGIGRSLVSAAAASVADPYLVELVTPEKMSILLGEGRIGTITVEGRPVALGEGAPALPAMFRHDWFSSVMGSSFDGLITFLIPIRAPDGARVYGVHLRLEGLTWCLSGIDLPPQLLNHVAHAILDAEQAKAP